MSSETASPPPPSSARFRIGRWLFGVAIGLIAFVVALLVFVAGTERGLRFGLAQAEALSGGLIRVGSASGHLLGSLDLRDVRYTGSDGTLVTIRRVHLKHQPSALLARRLHVEELRVDTLDVTPGPSKPPTTPPTPTTLPLRLPLDIRIDALTLDAFTLHPSPPAAGADAAATAGEPFVIAHAEFAGQWFGDTITVDRLDTALALTGPIAAVAKARMRQQAIDFESLQVKGPGEIAAQGRFGFEAVASDLKLTWTGLRWPFVPVDGKPPLASDLNGTAAIGGGLNAYTFDIATTAVLQDQPAQLAAKGSGSLAAVHLDHFGLDTLASERGGKPQPPGARGSVQAAGDVAWSPQLTADLKATFSKLDPSLFAAEFPGDLNGQLDSQTAMTGGEPEVTFTAALSDSSIRGKPFSLNVAGTAGARDVKLQDLLLKAGKGSVRAKGAVVWSPALKVNVDADIAKIDPAQFVPEWPGDLNGRIVVTTDAADNSPIVADAVIENSRLRGYPLKLAALADVAGEVVTIERLRLESGATKVTASGQASPPFALKGAFDSPNLGALLPELGGRAAFTFALDGTLEQPHLVTQGEAGALRYGDLRAQRLSWNANVDPMVDSKIAVDLAKADAGLQIEQVKLRMTGLEVYHRLELEADTERGKANLALQGGYDRVRNEWGGELAALGLAPSKLTAWALAKPAGILIGQKRRALESACLTGSGGEACFQLEQNVLADGARVGWNIKKLLIATLQPLLDPQMKVAGSLDGEGFVNFTGGDVAQAQAALNLREASVEVPDAPVLRLDVGSLRANQSADGLLTTTLELRAAQTAITADVAAAPGPSFMERALSGRIGLDAPSLAFLEPLVPALNKLDGKLNGAFGVSGTPAAPRLNGDVKLRDGQARLVVAGIDLKEVTLDLNGAGDDPLKLTGSAKSGTGALAIAGTIDPYARPIRADITVKGDEFQAMNTPQARAWISPDLRLVRDLEGLTLSGTLQVPRADITPKGLGGGGVDVSGDQVLIGVELPPKEPPLKVFVALKLALGKAVQIEGFGLKTRIEGAVTLTQQPARDALANGELRLIDGRYKAYGQDLNIETGRLLFSGGSVTTPAVDLYATRKPREDITVGVRVRGTLAKPTLTLQSSPNLPREQQLSWLVLGRSLETSSTQDRSLVSSAALSLGLGGGDYVAGLLGKKIGLDQLSVGGAAGSGSEVAANAQSISGAQSAGAGVDAGAQAAQLTLGKYLTPRLFVSYGISLFQDGYTFRMLYTLGRGFKLSTESGTASGGDVIYTTERGKKAPGTVVKPGVDAAPQAGPAPDPTRTPDAIPAPEPVTDPDALPVAPKAVP